MVSLDRTSARQQLHRLAVATAVKGADWALRVPSLRDVFLDQLLRRLRAVHDTYDDDPEMDTHIRFFGRHLEAFLRRLLRERPAAARAILRFIGSWILDVQKRSEAQRRGDEATPVTVVIEPTDRCNLSCPGCYAKSTRDGSDLPYEVMERIVQQVVDMGTTLVTVSGGEPFLREKADRTVTRLAERFDDRGFLVYTNGTLIDEEIAARLRRLGNIFPAISVEGNEHQTDARRGRGTYETDRWVRRLLREQAVMTGFSATVTRENCDAICSDDFLDMRIEEGDLFGWFFLLQPIGRSPRPDLMPTAEQRAKLRETINRWRTEDRPVLLGDFWNDGPLVGGCIAGGKYYFHIYANGDISPCVFAPVACGNIFDIIHGRSEYESLTDFVRRNPVFTAYRRHQKEVPDHAAPCLLIDHPEMIREIAHAPTARPAKNMAETYFEGEIAQAIDRAAAEWNAMLPNLSPHPAVIEAQQEAISEVGGHRRAQAAVAP